MNQLFIIQQLEKQLHQEINRLEQASILNLEKEFQKLRIYEVLIQEILKDHV